jgi:hypothetical protein
MQGLGQGTSASPASWIAVSTLPVEMMRITGFGISDWMAISNKVVRFVCYSFIDNMDLIHTSQDSDAQCYNVLQEIQTFSITGKDASKLLEEL